MDVAGLVLPVFAIIVTGWLPVGAATSLGHWPTGLCISPTISPCRPS